MGEIYSLTDLMNRYNISRQAIQQYLTSHMDDINADGIHAKKVKGDWQLDAIGLQKLDAMRGYNSNLALQAELRQENEKYKLLEEISTLKTAMLTIKEKYQQQQLSYRDKIDELKDRAHAAELLQLQSRAQLEQLEQAKAAAEQAAAIAQDRATAAEDDAAQERKKAEAAAKERDDEKNKEAEKLDKIKNQYNMIVEENSRLKAALRTERQKSWLDKLLGR
jgi:hypothetical protein